MLLGVDAKVLIHGGQDVLGRLGIVFGGTRSSCVGKAYDASALDLAAEFFVKFSGCVMLFSRNAFTKAG